MTTLEEQLHEAMLNVYRRANVTTTRRVSFSQMATNTAGSRQQGCS